jgi:hypothetical protein
MEMAQQEAVMAQSEILTHLPERTEKTAINLNQDGSDRAEIQAERTPNESQKCHCLGQPAR